MPHPDASAATRAPDAGPRAALAWALLAYALAALALGYPALAGQFLVSPISDQYIAGYAFRNFAAEQLRETGSFPLWNPYLAGGLPYVAAMHGDLFYPTALLRLVLGTGAGMTWGFILHQFLAGAFTYLFLRRIGVAFAGSLVGGLAYMLSGQIASYAAPGHDGKLYVSTLLPLFLWALHAGIAEGRRWAWGAIALIVGLGVLSPHPQLLQYMLLTGGFYAVFLAFATPATAGVTLERPVAVRRLAFSLGAIGLGMLIGAIQYWPVFEYVPFSPRSGGKGWEHAISYSMPIEELLINSWLPQFTGLLDAYWGRNGIHFHSEYLGIAALFLAGLGVMRGSAPRPGQRWFWIGVLVISALWALGGFTPFYSVVYALVPGTKYFRAPSTFYYVTSFAVAVLAGFGAQRLVAGGTTVRYVGGWLAGAALVLVLAFAGGFTSIGLTLAVPGREELVFANQQAVVLGAVRTAVFLALAAGVAVTAARGRLGARAATVALALVVAADLWSVERKYWRFSPPAEELYAANPITEYLAAQPEFGRVIPLGIEPTESRGPFLSFRASFDGLMALGIPQFLGYHGNELGRYQELIDGGPVGGGWLNPNVWKLYNVRYLLTNVAEAPLEGSTRVLGPVPDAVGTPLHLYRLPGEQRPAWVAGAIVKAPDDAVFATVLDPRFDVYSVALMSDSARVPGADLAAVPDALDLPTTYVREGPGRIRVGLGAPAPEGSALVVSENYYPGWRAAVDGRPAEVWRTDYVLLGVPLPAGAREVTLEFDSRPYELGRLTTWLAVAGSVLLVIVGIIADRRRSAGG